MHSDSLVIQQWLSHTGKLEKFIAGHSLRQDESSCFKSSDKSPLQESPVAYIFAGFICSQVDSQD